MLKILHRRTFYAAIIAFMIFIAAAAIAVSSLVGAQSSADIDHAMWVTWVLVVPAFIMAGLLSVAAVVDWPDPE